MAWDEEPVDRRVRRLRIALGLSQEDLGQRIGFSEMTINRIETGITPLVGEFLERLADGLEQTEEYLLNGDSHAERETRRSIGYLREKHEITDAEELRLLELSSGTLKLRSNARVPLSELELESLLMVIRGG